MTWIKICGTTSLGDARVAVEAGADALGFVFAEGPRQVLPAGAGAIIAALPAKVQKVGVFVNQPADLVRAVVMQAGLTGVQLHGDETPDYVRQLFPWQGTRRRCRIFKAIPVSGNFEAMVLPFTEEHIVDALLLDAHSPLARGGTGQPFDWQLASSAVQRLSERCKLILAGGLNPASVSSGMRLLHPWGVDVASGVERAPGKKDPVKVRAFVGAVRQADKGKATP